MLGVEFEEEYAHAERVRGMDGGGNGRLLRRTRQFVIWCTDGMRSCH
jgi:hypothetical protein